MYASFDMCKTRYEIFHDIHNFEFKTLDEMNV